MNLEGKLGDTVRVDASLSDLARGVIGSEILRIAAEIRAMKAKGAEIAAEVKKQFGHTVGVNRIYMVKTKLHAKPPARSKDLPRAAPDGKNRSTH